MTSCQPEAGPHADTPSHAWSWPCRGTMSCVGRLADNRARRLALRALFALVGLVVAAQGLLVYRASCPQPEGGITYAWHWGAQRMNTALCADYTSLYEYLVLDKWYWLLAGCAALASTSASVRNRLVARRQSSAA